MRILIIGVLEGHVTKASQIASKNGAQVCHIETIEGGLKALRSGQGADLVLIDVALNVKQLMTSLEAERFHIPVVACGVKNDANAAVKAIKAGAKEYIPLPPDSELIAAVLNAVAKNNNAVVYESPKMKALMKLADKLAPSGANILITGESGTGKEVLAQYIHKHSKQADKHFVSINCAAIPENLLESELFGHEKGAFTGAIAKRVGKFEEASGGTLLLDEISEMHPRLQAKLLRAIQEKEIDRVGGTKPIKINIRLIATSNRNLQEEVKAKNFREDLYFRLNVVSFHLPPLRERHEDIEVLANHFVKKYSEENHVKPKEIDKNAMEQLKENSWQGNIRELENTMHRAVLLAQDNNSIAIEDLNLPQPQDCPTTTKSDAESSDNLVGHTVAEIERELILNTLKHYLGNRTHAATILGISIRTLRNKLKQYSSDGINIPMPNDNNRLIA
jgi:two-component system, response regulator FlrC